MKPQRVNLQELERRYNQRESKFFGLTRRAKRRAKADVREYGAVTLT